MSKKVPLTDISAEVRGQNVHKTLRPIKQTIKKGWLGRQPSTF
ncbi:MULTISPECIES: hypothetical protein [Mesobacillus]|nr:MULTISPECIES: hypothetical protein [Mesobacillus]UYZ20497.1 hypothetical protein FOF60_15625 [Mesobacillus jeotgali]